MSKTLSEEQKKIVSDNHNLIYAYAHRKKLSLEEFYDILAIGLCKAATAYDESKGNTFSTLAYKCMENEMKLYYRDINKQSSVPSDNIMFFDAPTNSSNDDNITLLDILADTCDIQETVMSDLMVTTMLSSLNDKEKFIVECLMAGDTQDVIGTKMGCARQNINRTINSSIKKKLITYLSTN